MWFSVGCGAMLESDKRANKLAKEVVQRVGARHWRWRTGDGGRSRLGGASRLLYRPELADGCTSKRSSEEEGKESEGGLGQRSGPQPAVSTSLPANSSASIRHGRFLSMSPSAGWSSVEAAHLGALMGDVFYRRLTSRHHHFSPRSRFHESLSRRQSTLLTQLRIGACDLGAYKAQFEPDCLIVR